MEVILASQNQHKCQEFNELLSNWSLHTAPAFYCEEYANTYLGNAMLKAQTVQKEHPSNWILADDSGLEVAALQNRPGIFSARYGGLKLASERNALLLQELASFPNMEMRSARFVCCLVLLSPIAVNECYAAQSIAQGRIAMQPRSLQENAFGYDPIFELAESFYPDLELAGKTVAELSAKQKQTLSHRSLACAKLRSLLKPNFL